MNPIMVIFCPRKMLVTSTESLRSSPGSSAASGKAYCMERRMSVGIFFFLLLLHQTRTNPACNRHCPACENANAGRRWAKGLIDQSRDRPSGSDVEQYQGDPVAHHNPSLITKRGPHRRGVRSLRSSSPVPSLTKPI